MIATIHADDCHGWADPNLDFAECNCHVAVIEAKDAEIAALTAEVERLRSQLAARPKVRLRSSLDDPPRHGQPVLVLLAGNSAGFVVAWYVSERWNYVGAYRYMGGSHWCELSEAVAAIEAAAKGK